MTKALLLGLVLALVPQGVAAADPKALHREGLAAMAAGDWKAAVAALEAATAGAPDDLVIGTDYRQAIIRAAATPVSQPVLSGGTGVISALSMVSGAVLAFSRSANGFWKNAATWFGGRQLARSISIFAAGSSERTTFEAA